MRLTNNVESPILLPLKINFRLIPPGIIELIPKAFIAKEAGIDRFIHHWMYKQPTSCLWGIINLDEALSDELIENALKILINTVPILSARLKKGLWSGYWEFADPGNIKNLITRKRVTEKKEADRLLVGVIGNPVDPDHPPVIRVTSIDSTEDHYLILQVHHTAMDGEGSKQLFNLFATIYRELEKDPKWQPDSFPAMNRSWSQIAKHLKWHRFLLAPVVAFKELTMIIHALLRFRKTASTICGDYTEKNKTIFPEHPKMETLVINSNAIRSIKAHLKKEGATLNDFIMAAMMSTVNDWNSACGEIFSYVLSGYTVNLRRWWGQPECTFSNMSAICLASAKAEDLIDVHKALMALKPKFDQAKKEFGLKELWDLLTLRFQPELISRIFSFLIIRLVKKTHALTNIGIIPESAGNFGRIKAKTYSLVAPPLPSPNILFTATSYKDSLTIHCNFNQTHMKSVTAKKLMRQFRENILKFSGR